MVNHMSDRKMRSTGRPDDVSDRFPEGSIKLKTHLVSPESNGGDAPTVVIEGDELSLEYLGRLILAQAKYRYDCGFGISPKSAGNVFFKSGARIGLYIHRLPCLEKKEKAHVDAAAKPSAVRSKGAKVRRPGQKEGPQKTP
jgi:hypothetical protein